MIRHPMGLGHFVRRSDVMRVFYVKSRTEDNTSFQVCFTSTKNCRTSYHYRSFSAKEPYNKSLFHVCLCFMFGGCMQFTLKIAKTLRSLSAYPFVK